MNKLGKNILIGASVVAVLGGATIGGFAMFDKDLKVARNVLSSVGLGNLLGDTEEATEEEILAKAKEARIATIEGNLRDVYCGFSQHENYLDKKDDGTYTWDKELNNFYCFYSDIDKSKIVEKPEMKDYFDPDENRITNTGGDMNGRPISVNDPLKVVYERWVSDGCPENDGLSDTYTANDIKAFKKYHSACEKYQEWYDEREVFIDKLRNNKYLEKQEPDKNWSVYTDFWLYCAMKVMGEEFEEGSSADSLSNEALAKLEYYGRGYENRHSVDSPSFMNVILGNETLPDFSENDDHYKEKLEEYNATFTWIGKDNKEEDDDKKEDDNSGGGGSTTGGGGSTTGGGGSTTGGGGSSTGGGGSSTGGGGSTTGDDDDKKEESEAPVLNSIKVTSPTVSGTYRAGQVIEIKALFKDDVYGTSSKGAFTDKTAPVLFIKFGDGESKAAKFKSASGKSILYTYTISEKDSGKLVKVSNKWFVGDVYSDDGTKATFTEVSKDLGGSEIVADTTGPYVEKITSDNNSGMYKTGDTIEIKVKFDSRVYASNARTEITNETAPILNIKFGAGTAKATTFKNVSDMTITYTYTITDDDKGLLIINPATAFDGTKSIFDAAGNENKLKQGVEFSEKEISANEEVASVTLDKTSLELDLSATKTAQLTPTTKNTNATFEWYSENEDVATVSETGLVTAVGKGTTNIIVKTSDGTKATCEVKVVDANNPDTVIELKPTSATLDIASDTNKTLQIEATVTPTERKLTWTSSDASVATVSETGLVTAVKKGTATITAKAEDGVLKTVSITVKNSLTGDTVVTLNQTQVTVDMKDTKSLQLIATVTPESNESVTWSSSNTKVATVDEDGVVRFIAAGSSVTITATSSDGAKAECVITVTDTTVKDIEPTAITVNLDEAVIAINRIEKFVVTSTLTPSDANKNAGITYSVDDTSIATIDATTGELTLIQPGTVKITATTENGKTDTKSLKIAEMESTQKLGDANNDGKIDMNDVIKALRKKAISSSSDIKKKHSDWELTDAEFMALDIDGNGVIDMSDVIKMLRHIAASSSSENTAKHQDWIIAEDWKRTDYVSKENKATTEEPVETETPVETEKVINSENSVEVNEENIIEENTQKDTNTSDVIELTDNSLNQN